VNIYAVKMIAPEVPLESIFKGALPFVGAMLLALFLVHVFPWLGHKDDALAGEAAYLLSKSIRRPVCVIAGVHLDNITREEIDKILANTKIAISEIIRGFSHECRE
jgi:hypothetical protein